VSFKYYSSKGLDFGHGFSFGHNQVARTLSTLGYKCCYKKCKQEAKGKNTKSQSNVGMSNMDYG
jgi:hypothetical protein